MSRTDLQEPKDYLAHACDAERLAQRSITPDERKAYERIAAVWRELASVEMDGEVSGVAREADAVSPPEDATAPPRQDPARSR